MDPEKGLPIPPHVASDFFAWLWWSSEANSALFKLPDPVGRVDVWVDERLSFRNPDDAKVTAVMTGENPSASLEARAALAGGKVLHELRLGLRRDDREYFVTLKGPAMHLQALKLPTAVNEGGEEVIFERMHLYEELVLVVGALFRHWATQRRADAWQTDVLPALRAWVAGDG